MDKQGEQLDNRIVLDRNAYERWPARQGDFASGGAMIQSNQRTLGTMLTW